MKKILTSFVLLTLIQLSYAQKLVTVSHNGVTSFYTGNTAVNDAVAAALMGDTIYIPGGGFSIGTLTIDKSLTIYGVGHAPDSTAATYRTELSGTIVLVQGASNTQLEGFYITGNIRLGSNAGDQFVQHVSIRRINLQTLQLSYDGSSPTTSNNIVVEENWIRNELHAGYASGVLIQQNFIAQGFRYASNVLFTNNILFGSYCGGGPFSSIDNCMIQNNFINVGHGPCWGNYFVSGNSNHFANNVTNLNWSFPDGTNTGTGNWFNTSTSAFFVNCPGASFDYTYDYHAQTPASFLGTDGTEVGVYGTVSPAKMGWVPENPHVSTKVIAPQTTPSGDLNINITVGAQND
jgi:hypothetical protein